MKKADKKPEQLDLRSMSLTEDKKTKLKQLFPEVFNEGKIDWDKLKRTLGEELDTGRELYDNTWPGKNHCFRIIQERSSATLKPCPNESLDWDNTQNLFIEGDNLEVLKILQKSYYNKVKMIYIDPPYNTGKDFIYPDKFSASLETYLQYTGQSDDEGTKFSTNQETDGRFHSNWLNMMYPRLFLARNLLKDDGVIFISIDDNEVANLRKICDDIFGEENFVGCAGRVTKKSNNKGNFWAPNFDYILTYTKDIEYAKSFFGGVNTSAYNHVEQVGLRKGEKYQLVRLYMSTIRARNPRQRFWIKCPDGSEVIPPGSTFPPQKPILGDGIWRWTKKKFEAEQDKIVIKKTRTSNLIDKNKNPAKYNVFTKTYLQDVIDNSSAKPNSLIEEHINQKGSHELRSLKIPFDYSKPSSLIKYLIEVSKTEKDDIILDFFAGSATTAHAVYEKNKEDGGSRKYICVQLPEPIKEGTEAHKVGFKTIADIGKERIRRAVKKIKEEDKQQSLLNQATRDRDFGFRVFKLSPSNFRFWDQNPPSPPCQGGIPENQELKNQESKDQDQTNQKLKAQDRTNQKFETQDRTNQKFETQDQTNQKSEDQVRNNQKSAKQTELQMEETIDPNSSKEDLLFEILLKTGFSLTTPVKILKLAGKKVYCVQELTKDYEDTESVDNNIDSVEEEPALLICLEDKITKQLIYEMAKLYPARVVCLDKGFEGQDWLKVNAKKTFDTFQVRYFKVI